MNLQEIRRIPTDTSEFARTVDEKDPMIHESCFRSFHIVEKVVELLKKETPTEVIIEIIEDLKSNINHRYTGADKNGQTDDY